MHKLSARHRMGILRPLAVACGVAALGGCATPPPPPVTEAAAPVMAPAAPMIRNVPKSKPARIPPEIAARPPVPAVARPAPASLPWPVRGQIVREFGPQPSGARNDGVDIAANEGSAVVAVQDGVVTYAGSDLPGYGNMLLVTHPGGYISVYAHNQLLLAWVGAKVSRGQQIATVGHWGGVGEAGLHFQLRAGERPVDPEPLFEPQPTLMASLAADVPPLGAR
ncbi:MAG: murein hydrolase activator EnvC [Geminicoccaceae bacterium]